MPKPFDTSHPWNVTINEAHEIQQQLRGQVICHDQLDRVQTVAGIDVGFEDQGRITCAAVAVLAFPSLRLLAYHIARQLTQFPYVSGLLSFRELPAVLEARSAISPQPDLLLCDGQGLAHPRRLC